MRDQPLPGHVAVIDKVCRPLCGPGRPEMNGESMFAAFLKIAHGTLHGLPALKPLGARTALTAACACCAFTLLLPLVPPGSGSAAEPDPNQNSAIVLTEQERTWLKAHPVLTIFSDHDMAPYGFTDERGNYVGVMPDIATRLEQLLGIRIKFKPVPYATLIELVDAGSIDAAALIDPLDVSWDLHYQMSNEVQYMPYGLFVRKDSDIAQQPEKTITGKTIALIKGWDLENPSLDPLRSNRFVFADSYIEALTLVLHGQADAFFDVHPSTNYQLARSFIKDIKAVKIYHQGYPACFFTRTQYQELHSAMQKALAAISRRERMELLRKWNAFMEDAAFALAALDLNPDERAWLKKHPVISVGIDAHWAPLEFVDTGNQPRGISIDYLQRLGHMLGVRFDIMADRPWYEYLDMAGRGEIDMLSGVVETQKRARRLAFTRPYITMPVVILTREEVTYVPDLRELEGLKVAVLRGFALQEWLERDHPDIELVTCESVNAMLQLLDTNQVYACIESLPAAGYYLGKSGYTTIKVSGQTHYTYPVSMAVRQDYRAFATILQKAFDAIPPGEHAEHQRRWMAVPPQALPDYRLIIKVVAPLLALLLLLSYWALLLVREIRSRKKAQKALMDAQDELEQINRELEYRVRQRTLELEQALHDVSESRERFQAIADHSPDAIIITDRTANVLYCNQAIESMFGYTRDELTGSSASVLVPERLQKQEAANMQRYQQTGQPAYIGSIVESWAMRKDGTEFPMELSLCTWDIDGETFFASIIRDITLRRQSEKTLRESQVRFSKMAENIQEGLAIVENGEIVYWNNRMYEILGCPQDKLPRFEDLDFFDPEDKKRMAHLLEHANQTGDLPSELEFWIQRPDGSRRCIQNRYAVQPGTDGLLNRYVVCSDITERKLAEEALQRERERLTRIIMTSPIIICSIAADGTATFINKTGTEITGYTLDDLSGRNWWTTFYPGTMYAQVEKLFDTISHGEDVTNFEMTLQTKSGQWRTILWNSMTGHDEQGRMNEIFGFGNDITERKKAEDEVRQARDYITNLFKASPDAILVADPDGYIIMANESVQAVYGYHPDEIIGKHASMLTPQNDRSIQQSLSMMEQLFSKDVVRIVEADRLRKDGRIIQVESSIVLLKNPDGNVAGAISSSRDVTDRKRLEEQLRQSQKMESIGTLAGGIAHDFNNILGVIFGYAELSREQAADNTVLANNITQILKAAERAKNLIRQILAFSRKSTFEAVPLHTHLIIKEALTLLRASLPSSISMQSDIDTTHDIVMADATQIHQVIINLCTNAAHAMRDTGGTLEVTLKPVDFDENSAAAYNGIEPGPYVQLSVRDTGTGIASDVIGRIFEPFFTTKAVGTGTGMGLSVVHGIVKSLRGDIKVYSEPGSGTVFHVVLPRRSEGTADQETPVLEPPCGNEAILLVDDEKLLLDVGLRLLNSLGYTVTSTHNPLEALALFKEDPAAFDAVITDQTMPDMTGFELARHMLEIRPDIPIILCTGYSDLVTSQSARDAGIREFIIKPLDRLTIAKTLRAILDPPKASAQ